MKKMYLLSYESPEYLVLEDWIDYRLKFEVFWFNGLFKTYKTIKYRIYNYQNSKSFFEYWDKIIEKKQPFK